MIETNSGRRRSLHAGSFAVAIGVGAVVWVAARALASGSCPTHDLLRVVSSCRALVGSLAFRMGVVAAAAVLLMEIVAAGLLRTAETMDEDRDALEREARAGVTSG